MKVTIDDLTEEELLEAGELDSLFEDKSFQLSRSDLEGVSDKAIWFLMGSHCGGLFCEKAYRELPDTIEEAKERLCSDTIRKFEERRNREVAQAVAMGIDVAWC